MAHRRQPRAFEPRSDYARRLRVASPYTPQLVVDGQTELVGSLASASAFAADAPKAAAPAKTAAAKPHHMKSCDDYAYESQAAKDCMAKGDMKMKKSSKGTTSPTRKQGNAFRSPTRKQGRGPNPARTDSVTCR